MSLLALALERNLRKGPPCSVKLLLEQKADRADEIRELLAVTGSQVPYVVASETLNEALDVIVNPATLSRHVRRKCGCEPA